MWSPITFLTDHRAAIFPFSLPWLLICGWISTAQTTSGLCHYRNAISFAKFNRGHPTACYLLLVLPIHKGLKHDSSLPTCWCELTSSSCFWRWYCFCFATNFRLSVINQILADIIANCSQSRRSIRHPQKVETRWSRVVLTGSFGFRVINICGPMSATVDFWIWRYVCHTAKYPLTVNVHLFSVPLSNRRALEFGFTYGIYDNR